MVKQLFIVLVLGLCAFACENREPEPKVVPDWLIPRLEELESSGDCFGCTVQRSTYLDQYYYHLYCSYWSCSHCEVYNDDGTLVEWSEDFPLSDWLKNRQQVVQLWSCGEKLHN